MSRRQLLARIAAALLIAGCGSSTPATAPTEEISGGQGEEAPRVVETFSGVYRVPAATADDYRHLEFMSPRVIADAAEFTSFVAQIPKTRIQQRLPAPPSDDPLLSRDDIDWDTQMMLIAFDPQSMYGHVRFGALRLEGSTLIAEVVKEPMPGREMAARVLDVGFYAAILIERHDGPVTFQW